MSNNTEKVQTNYERFAEIFTLLPEHDITQFYTQYQLWLLHHRLPILEKQLEVLHEHITENQLYVQSTRPPAIALAVLARLESKGVNEIEVLDQMLARGEDWLDRTMQRLDYCEQVEDFIQGDYTQWCVNSLDGAYDWIDSLRDSSSESLTPPILTTDETAATAELLLQKLKTDDEDAMHEVTFIHPSPTSDVQPSSQPITAPLAALPDAQTTRPITVPLETPDSAAPASTEHLLAAMENWENLESIDEEDAPWYASEENELRHFDQPGAMNDWIKVLQDDTLARLEAGETAITAYTVAEIITPEISDPQAQPSEHSALVDEETIDTLTPIDFSSLPDTSEAPANSAPTLPDDELIIPSEVELSALQTPTEPVARPTSPLTLEPEEAEISDEPIDPDETDKLHGPSATIDELPPAHTNPPLDIANEIALLIGEQPVLLPTDEELTLLTSSQPPTDSKAADAVKQLATPSFTRDNAIDLPTNTSHTAALSQVEALSQIIPTTTESDLPEQEREAEPLALIADASAITDTPVAETTPETDESAIHDDSPIAALAPKTDDSDLSLLDTQLIAIPSSDDYTAAILPPASPETHTPTNDISTEETLVFLNVIDPGELHTTLRAHEIEEAAMTNTILDAETSADQLPWNVYLEIDAINQAGQSAIEEHSLLENNGTEEVPSIPKQPGNASLAPVQPPALIPAHHSAAKTAQASPPEQPRTHTKKLGFWQRLFRRNK